MNIPKFFLLVTVFVLGGCSFNQDKALANLDFSRIARVRDTPVYNLYFSADIDILGSYKSRVGEKLMCALADDVDFNLDHRMKYFAQGAVARDKTQPGFKFVSQIIFNESISAGASERALGVPELKGLLSNKEYVACRFLVSATMTNTYFSNVMYVPVVRIKQAVDGK
ncbi:hypothetical protein LOY38_08635 [Pseudomonas sp. B21-015]|uniref:hypothetical protein n=1 Tax=Pseudomonas sp. B21-015 TaxID=2895473 RepID=UPI00215E6044|nr:hypothetical protein [Pseudomonas sp. B21-015]UVM52084.1 hypothetical protein LOY38_08635 [Pseudomonas sp. B21-015]